MSAQSRENGGMANAIIAGLALLALVVGIVLLLTLDGIAAMVAGIVLIGLAGIALVSLAFLVVGQGEDRDRMRNPRG
jgi:hypothetical protein